MIQGGITAEQADILTDMQNKMGHYRMGILIHLSDTDIAPESVRYLDLGVDAFLAKILLDYVFVPEKEDA